MLRRVLAFFAVAGLCVLLVLVAAILLAEVLLQLGLPKDWASGFASMWAVAVIAVAICWLVLVGPPVENR